MTNKEPRAIRLVEMTQELEHLTIMHKGIGHPLSRICEHILDLQDALEDITNTFETIGAINARLIRRIEALEND